VGDVVVLAFGVGASLSLFSDSEAAGVYEREMRASGWYQWGAPGGC